MIQRRETSYFVLQQHPGGLLMAPHIVLMAQALPFSSPGDVLYRQGNDLNAFCEALRSLQGNWTTHAHAYYTSEEYESLLKLTHE